MRSTLYCVMAYIVACVDASRTVFWDRSNASYNQVHWLVGTPYLSIKAGADAYNY